MRWKLVVGLWKELVQCFYWNRCRVSSAARNFDTVVLHMAKSPTRVAVLAVLRG